MDSCVGPSKVVGLLTPHAEILGLQYPTGQTFEHWRGVEGIGAQSELCKGLSTYTPFFDAREQEELANLKEKVQSSRARDWTLNNIQWHSNPVDTLRGDVHRLNQEKPNHRHARSASWKAALAKFSSDGGKIKASAAKGKQWEGIRNSQRLPLSSLLEVAVLRRFVRQERDAELRYTQKLWYALKIPAHFEKMQGIFLMGGDEQLYGAIKDIVDVVFDISSTTPGSMDRRTLVRRQLTQPYAVKTMKTRLPRVLEDRIRELDNGEAFRFSVTMDTNRC